MARPYSAVIRQRALKLRRANPEIPIRHLARELGIHEVTLATWLEQATRGNTAPVDRRKLYEERRAPDTPEQAAALDDLRLAATELEAAEVALRSGDRDLKRAVLAAITAGYTNTQLLSECSGTRVTTQRLANWRGTLNPGPSELPRLVIQAAGHVARAERKLGEARTILRNAALQALKDGQCADHVAQWARVGVATLQEWATTPAAIPTELQQLRDAAVRVRAAHTDQEQAAISLKQIALTAISLKISRRRVSMAANVSQATIQEWKSPSRRKRSRNPA